MSPPILRSLDGILSSPVVLLVSIILKRVRTKNFKPTISSCSLVTFISHDKRLFCIVNHIVYFDHSKKLQGICLLKLVLCLCSLLAFMVMKPFEEMLHDKSFYKNIILTFIEKKKLTMVLILIW